MLRHATFVRFLLLLPVVLLLSGCIVTQKVYLNQVDVEGPIGSLPINPRIEAEPPGVQITPRIAVGGRQTLDGKFTITSREDYSRADGKLTWALPAAQYGCDVMLRPSPGFGVNLGMGLSSVSGRSQSFWRLGLQLSSLKEGLGVAFDAGLQFTSLRVHARSTVITEINSIFGSGRYIDYYDDTVEKTSLGGYLGLTLNSVFPESRMNVFLNGGVVWQPLLNYYAGFPDPIFGPGDMHTISPRLRESLAFLSVTPGITLELGNQNRLIFGTQMIFPVEIDSPDPQPVFQPVVQCTIGM